VFHNTVPAKKGDLMQWCRGPFWGFVSTLK